MHLESGDYFNTDTEHDLQTAVLRLQTYAQSLREKLETEKLWLASLKSETQLLLAQKGSPFPDGRHLPQCPMSKQESSNSLTYHRRVPSSVEVSSTSLPHQQRMPSTLHVSQASEIRPEYIPHAGHIPYPSQEGFNTTNFPQPTNETVYNQAFLQSLPDEDLQKLAERQNYLQKLTELDNMCKQEMARISQVGYELEPLNQLASDWSFQAQLSNPKTSVKEYIAMAMSDKSPNITADGHLFFQKNADASKAETDCNFQPGPYVTLINTESPRQLENTQEVKTNLFDRCELNSHNEVLPLKPEVTGTPPTDKNNTPLPEKESVRRTVTLRTGVTFLPHKDEPQSPPQRNAPKLESPMKINSQKKEKKPQVHRSNVVAPIVWDRLAVDKKKKTLKQSSRPDLDSHDFKSVNHLSSEEADSTEEDTNSGDNHFASAVEREFLRKYMSSDSNFVYSPLFISESEEST